MSYYAFLLKFGSVSGQQQTVSTQTVLGGSKVDGKEVEEEERLCLVGNIISVDIFYTFLDSTRLNGNYDIVKGKIMQPTCLHA